MFVSRRGPRSQRAKLRDAVGAFDVLSRRRSANPPEAKRRQPRTLKKYAQIWGISVAHFDPDAARVASLGGVRPRSRRCSVEGSTYSRRHLKQRLYASGLKQRSCELCGQGEIWRGRRMALILDHVNGVATDNRLENLQHRVPELRRDARHALWPRQPATSSAPRPARLSAGPSSPTDRSRTATALASCVRAKDASPREPAASLAARRVERPPYEQLMREIAETSWSAVGRKYGVSDNAVRKWVRWYEAELDAA